MRQPWGGGGLPPNKIGARQRVRRRLGTLILSGLIWSCLTSPALYPFDDACRRDSSNGNLSTGHMPIDSLNLADGRDLNGGTNNAIQGSVNARGVPTQISVGSRLEFSGPAEYECVPALWWACYLNRVHLYSIGREEILAPKYGRYSVIESIEDSFGKAGSTTNETVVPRIDTHVGGDTAIKPRVGLGYWRADSSKGVSDDVVNGVPSISGKGKELTDSDLGNFTGIKNALSLDPARVGGDVNVIPYHFDDDFSTRPRAAKENGEKAQYYYRVTAVPGKISGLLHIDSAVSTFNITNADIDISSDGETWFHLFGSRCVAHLERFEIGN